MKINPATTSTVIIQDGTDANGDYIPAEPPLIVEKYQDCISITSEKGSITINYNNVNELISVLKEYKKS